MLKKFKLTALVTVSARTVVLAEDEESARTIANERSSKMNDRHGRDIEDHWLVEDIDGEPYDIEVTES